MGYEPPVEKACMELIQAVAFNVQLKAVRLFLNRCDCKEKITEILSNNFSLKKFWLYECELATGETFRPLMNRNRIFRKQKRYKSVKPVPVNSE